MEGAAFVDTFMEFHPPRFDTTVFQLGISLSCNAIFVVPPGFSRIPSLLCGHFAHDRGGCSEKLQCQREGGWFDSIEDGCSIERHEDNEKAKLQFDWSKHKWLEQRPRHFYQRLSWFSHGWCQLYTVYIYIYHVNVLLYNCI